VGASRMGAAADDARIHAVGISSFGRSWGKESNHRGADPCGPRDKFDLSGITPFMCRGASAQAGLRAAGRGGRAGDIGSRRGLGEPDTAALLFLREKELGIKVRPKTA
jgi:hypothetical protein